MLFSKFLRIYSPLASSKFNPLLSDLLSRDKVNQLMMDGLVINTTQFSAGVWEDIIIIQRWPIHRT